MNNEKHGRKISARIAARISDLAEKLYDFLPPIGWMTEVNLAEKMQVSPRQIKYAKSYLESIGKIKIQLRQNGKRSNPIHTLIKVFPINQDIIDELIDESNENENSIDWSLFNDTTIEGFNRLSLEEKLDYYQRMRLPFIPLHFPKFDKQGNAFCSCRFGHNCDSIGKHPAVAYKSLDFSSRQTYKAMKSFWLEQDNRYNIGFIVDGFTVIDVDFRHGGAYSLELLEEIYGELPKNLMVKTGNGLHIYARGNNRIQNAVNVLGFQGIDIRSKGSVVVAPFSDHKSGKQYEWLSISEPEPLPLELIRELQDINDNSKSRELYKQSGNQITTSSSLPSQYDFDYMIPNGERNTVLFRLASRERGRGAEQDEIYSFLLKANQRCIPPLEERALGYIAKSVMRYKPNREKYRFSRQNVANI